MHTKTKIITIEYSEQTWKEQNLTLEEALNQHGIHVLPGHTPPLDDGYVYPSLSVGETNSKEETKMTLTVEEKMIFAKEYIHNGSVYKITADDLKEEKGVIMDIDQEGIHVFLPDQNEDVLIGWEEKTSLQPLLPEHEDVDDAIKELDDLTASLIDTGEERYGYLISHYIDVVKAHLKK